MKNTFVILAFVFASFASQAQDTIRKSDGSVILALVKEIDSETIVYTLYDQVDGPIRKISMAMVSEIVYKDGTKEIFTNTGTPGKTEVVVKSNKPSTPEPGTINTSNETIIIHRRGPDLRVLPGERVPGGSFTKDHFFSNGVYLDAMIGFAGTSKWPGYDYSGTSTSTYTRYSNVTFGVRFGSKFYFGANEKRRFGVNVAWLNLTALLNDSNRGDVLFAPVNFGLASVFKLGDHTAVEVNTTTGMAVSTLFDDVVGIKYGADVKFRYDSFAVGLDMSRTSTIFGTQSEYGNLLALSAGFKF